MKRIIIYTIIFCTFSFGVLSWRVFYSDTISYIFLIWNLFLAFIPFVASILLYKYRSSMKAIWLMAGIAFWLLFFPNCPYILTDLFHLRIRPPMPLWFDLGLILTFALNALLMGFISLYLIASIIKERFGKSLSFAFVHICLIAAAFGVYVGRYLRWNSWDIVAQPYDLLYELSQIFLYPMDHSRAWGLTLMYSVMMILSYQLINGLASIKSKERIRT